MDINKQYSVLIVDDEEDVIRIIMEMVDWEQLGFRLAGYAHNGVEALELCEEVMPDVVMTDIKMPYMDGLTLGHRLKERDPGVKLIIFSGFDEFEYAKEAIKLEVEEYLLKPIDMQEMTTVFTRIKESLDRERDERKSLDKLQEYYMESLPLLQESFFTALLEGRFTEEQIPQYLTSYQIEMEGPVFLAAGIHISAGTEDDDMTKALRTMQVRRALEEQEQPYRIRSLFYLRDIVLLVQLDSREDVTGFTDYMDSFSRMASRQCEAAVTVGIGNVCSTVCELPTSYRNARQAVSYRAIYGTKCAINIAEIDPAGASDVTTGSALVQDIIKQIRLGDRERLEQKLAYCVAALTAEGSGREQVTAFSLELLAELTSLGSTAGLGMEEIFAEASGIMSQLFDSAAPEQLRDALSELTLHMQDQLNRCRQTTTDSFVVKAEEYVQEHYADGNISIESVCRYLGVSAAYFSTVFKKETGKTFIGYLTDYRMNKAVELLTTTADRTYLIADKVGYADSNYFSYVFKKQYGVSPSKYRQKVQQGEITV